MINTVTYMYGLAAALVIYLKDISTQSWAVATLRQVIN